MLKKNLYLFLPAGILLILIFLLNHKKEINGDEIFHYSQIKNFLNGNIALEPYLTVLPGFHFLLAIPAKISGLNSLAALRFYNFLLGLISILLFHKISSHIDHNASGIKTGIFIFLPILFPYRYLLYTENLSILMILLAYWFHLKQHSALSGISAFIALFIRQSNVIWLLYLLSHSIIRDKKKINIFTFKKYFFHLAGLMFFAIFLIANKGITLGITKTDHQFTFALGNIFLFLFLYFIFFFPFILAQIKLIFRLIINLKVLSGIAVFVTVNILTFKIIHPWNMSPDYLRNLLLINLEQNLLFKLMFFAAVSISIVSLFLIKMHNKSNFLFFPIAVVSLSSHALIEPRYTILPFTILLLSWKSNEKVLLQKILAICFILSLVSAHLVLNKYFHL